LNIPRMLKLEGNPPLGNDSNCEKSNNEREWRLVNKCSAKGKLRRRKPTFYAKSIKRIIATQIQKGKFYKAYKIKLHLFKVDFAPGRTQCNDFHEGQTFSSL
jgi:hypothetical protein